MGGMAEDMQTQTLTAVETHEAIEQARRDVAAQGLSGELDKFVEAATEDYAKVRVLFAEREAAQPVILAETTDELVARLSRRAA